MQINGLQAANSVHQVARAANSKPTESVQSAQPINGSMDQLDLSPEAQRLMSAEGVSSSSEGDLRMERIATIRQAIADGTYETPERMSAALDRFLDSYA
jgi:negative regulator of flagellin synthesis FlgM